MGLLSQTGTLSRPMHHQATPLLDQSIIKPRLFWNYYHKPTLSGPVHHEATPLMSNPSSGHAPYGPVHQHCPLHSSPLIHLTALAHHLVTGQADSSLVELLQNAMPQHWCLCSWWSPGCYTFQVPSEQVPSLAQCPGKALFF